MSNDEIKGQAEQDNNSMFPVYSDYLIKYRNLLTTRIFEKTEQIKNEFRSFCKINGLSVFSVPDSLEGFDGEKLRLKLTFLHPQPERAQVFLTIYFTSPKEFYINIYHQKNPVSEKFSTDIITAEDVNHLKGLYEDLMSSDVFISYYDKDRLTDPDQETKYSNFIDIIEQLYTTPRKF